MFPVSCIITPIQDKKMAESMHVGVYGVILVLAIAKKRRIWVRDRIRNRPAHGAYHHLLKELERLMVLISKTLSEWMCHHSNLYFPIDYQTRHSNA